VRRHSGKLLPRRVLKLRRGMNVESHAAFLRSCKASNLEDVARGIDEMMIRQPLAWWRPSHRFNFPAMIPLWFLPYAIACGNTFILSHQKKFRHHAAALPAC